MALTAQQQSFVDLLMPHAIAASQRTGVDPRIIIAQAAQETGWGRHAPNNNYFGIKSHGQGGGADLTTFEYENGQPVTQQASFRQYGSPAESVADYADFLLQNQRYRPMMAARGLDAQIAALGRSGYATDPNYAASVGSIARSIPAQTGGAMAYASALPPQPSRNMSKDYTPSGKPAGVADVANVANAANATAQAPAMNFPILDRIRARLGDRPTPFLDRIQERLTEFRTNRMERQGGQPSAPSAPSAPSQPFTQGPLGAGSRYELEALQGGTHAVQPAAGPAGGTAGSSGTPLFTPGGPAPSTSGPAPFPRSPGTPLFTPGGPAPSTSGPAPFPTAQPFNPYGGGRGGTLPPPSQGQVPFPSPEGFGEVLPEDVSRGYRILGQSRNLPIEGGRGPLPAAALSGGYTVRPPPLFGNMGPDSSFNPFPPVQPLLPQGGATPPFGPQGPGLSRPNGPSPINLMSILGLTEPQPGVLPRQPSRPSPLMGSMGGQNDQQAGLRRFLAAVLGNG